MEGKRPSGRTIKRFNSFEEVKEEIRDQLLEEFEWVKEVEFGNPEVFRKDEVRRTKIIVNGNYDWDIYIPFEELDFWNGMYSKGGNFESQMNRLEKTIRYYHANGST